MNKHELSDLFTDCFLKRRIILNSKNFSQQNIDEFNTYRFPKTRLLYKQSDLSDLDISERPDFLLFYNTGQSAVVEVVAKQHDLDILLKNKQKTIGDYRFLLRLNNISYNSIPDTFGILNIAMVEKKKYPHIILERPAVMVSKDYYKETMLLTIKLNRINNKISKIHQISSVGV